MTPRRLALAVHGVPARQADVREEKKGPRVGAPENAIAGFLKAAGLTSISEAKVQPDKKGDFYVAVIEKPGRAAIEVIAEILSQVIKTFPVAEIHALGRGVEEPGALNWVRPLHSIVATFGPETEEPDIVPLRDRRHHASATRRAAIASWRRRRSPCAGSTTICRSSTRPRWCRTPSAGATSS